MDQSWNNASVLQNQSGKLSEPYADKTKWFDHHSLKLYKQNKMKVNLINYQQNK